jgi:hypothetical protein
VSAAPITLEDEQLEQLADLIAARLRPPVDVEPGPALLTAAELAERLGVSREYVYRNAAALGAIRLPSSPPPKRPGPKSRKPGSGEQGRLRFDLAAARAANGRLTFDRSQEQTASDGGASARSPRPRRPRSPNRSPKPAGVLASRPRPVSTDLDQPQRRTAP